MNAFAKRLLFVATIYLASSIAVPARADVVTDWNNAALDAIRANNTAPPIASRSLAILHASIYDAVNGIARTNEPYLVPGVAPASASRPAAASAAAHRTLVHLFPANASSFDALNATILAGIPDGPRKRAGIVWGEFVATVILVARAHAINATNSTFFIIVSLLSLLFCEGRPPFQGFSWTLYKNMRHPLEYISDAGGFAAPSNDRNWRSGRARPAGCAASWEVRYGRFGEPSPAFYKMALPFENRF